MSRDESHSSLISMGTTIMAPLFNSKAACCGFFCQGRPLGLLPWRYTEAESYRVRGLYGPRRFYNACGPGPWLHWSARRVLHFDFAVCHLGCIWISKPKRQLDMQIIFWKLIWNMLLSSLHVCKVVFKKGENAQRIGQLWSRNTIYPYSTLPHCVILPVKCHHHYY